MKILAACVAVLALLVPSVALAQGASFPPPRPQVAVPTGNLAECIGQSGCRVGMSWGKIRGGSGANTWQFIKSPQISLTWM